MVWKSVTDQRDDSTKYSVSLRILYSLWHYRDSNILAYGYELVLT